MRNQRLEGWSCYSPLSLPHLTANMTNNVTMNVTVFILTSTKTMLTETAQPTTNMTTAQMMRVATAILIKG